MTNTGRAAGLWPAIGLAVAGLVLSACSETERSPTPVSPTGPSPVSPVTRIYFPLQIDSSTASELLPTDPPGYVGEAYESDFSWNTKYFTFTAPDTDDVIVEISWAAIENAPFYALRMWALNGILVSEPSSTGAVLSLPHGTTGVLLVGRPHAAGRLKRSVAFTLDARRVTPAGR